MNAYNSTVLSQSTRSILCWLEH